MTSGLHDVMILQDPFLMLYKLDIDIGVYNLFLILCCPVYMVRPFKTNPWCLIADFIPLLFYFDHKYLLYTLLFQIFLSQVAEEMVN